MKIELPKKIAAALDASSRENLLAAARQLLSPYGLVPFVGAGVSRKLGMPDWADFLRRSAPPAVAEDVQQRLADGEFERAAEVIEGAMAPIEFTQRLKTEFGAEPENLVPDGTAAALIPRLAKGLVVTTNFDRVLEAAFIRQGKPLLGHELFIGSRFESLFEVIARGGRALWKMHGDARSSADRVLTPREYQRAYPVSGGGSGLNPAQAFKRVADQVSLLFIGASLGTDRTVACLRELAAQTEQVRHFAIMSKPPDVLARQSELHRMGIHPIWYPAGQHEWLTELLSFLVGVRAVAEGEQEPNVQGLYSLLSKLMLCQVGFLVWERVEPGKIQGGLLAIALAIGLPVATAWLAVSVWHFRLRQRRGLAVATRFPTICGLDRATWLRPVSWFLIAGTTLWSLGHFLDKLSRCSMHRRASGLSPQKLPAETGETIWSYFDNLIGDRWRWDHYDGFSAFPGFQPWVYYIWFWLLVPAVIGWLLWAWVLSRRRG